MQMVTMRRGRGWSIGGLVIASLWFGLLLGVSFLATPVKFLAPSLTLPVALDIGRHTFAVLNKIEWVTAVLLLFLLLGGCRSWLANAAAIIAALLVLAETVWLLPALDQRVSLIIAGQPLPISSDHNIYIAIDIMKLAALALVIWAMALRLSKPPPGP